MARYSVSAAESTISMDGGHTSLLAANINHVWFNMVASDNSNGGDDALNQLEMLDNKLPRANIRLNLLEVSQYLPFLNIIDGGHRHQ